MKKIILLSAFALLIIGGSMAYYFYQKPVQGLADADPFAQTSATELFARFNENEQEAASDYNGKVLEITGKVVEVITNSDNSSTLVLASEDLIFGVKCRIDPKYNEMPIPETGEQVRLKGLCTGFNSDVELNQCVIL